MNSEHGTHTQHGTQSEHGTHSEFFKNSFADVTIDSTIYGPSGQEGYPLDMSVNFSNTSNMDTYTGNSMDQTSSHAAPNL